jgi:hypothetical protein
MLTPFRDDTLPLIAHRHDLEASGQGACDSVEVVCDLHEVVCDLHDPPHVPTYINSPTTQFERVSPFSESHPPFLRRVLALDV